MKKHPSHLNYLAAAMLAAYAVAGHAAAPTSGAYITDKTNQYVEDETSQVLSKVNGVLCHVDAMAPSKLPNATYIALIDSNVCNANGNAGNNNGGNNGGPAGGGGGGGGGNNNNGAASYTKAVVETTQATGEALLANVWLDGGQGSKIQAHLSALQAPTDTLPYGEFRLDYCGTTAAATSNCDREKGYISAGPGGLMYYSLMKETRTVNAIESAVQTIDSVAITAASVDSGSGAVTSQERSVVTADPNPTNPTTGKVTLTTTSTSFAYNAAYFMRSGDTGLTYKCFDRSLANADKTAWTYGLYEEATGGHYNRLTGFPIDFTDANGKHNGWMGYWGFWSDAYDPVTWMPILPADGSTINGYVNNAATPTSYIFKQTGGKLIKHTRALKTLDQLDKVRFYYYSPTYVPSNCTPAAGSLYPNPNDGHAGISCILDQWVQYEIYWDKATKQFMTASEQNTTTWTMTPMDTQLAIPSIAIVDNNLYGLSAWSSMTGGSFNIDATELSSLISCDNGATITPGSPSTYVYDSVTYTWVLNPPTPSSCAGGNVINNPAAGGLVDAKFVSDDIVYPADFATMLPNGLKCIGDCPTAAQIAAWVAAPAISLSGTTTATSATVTMASTAGVVVGMRVAGTGIPAGATVSAITPNTSITLNVAASASGTATLSFATSPFIPVTADQGFGGMVSYWDCSSASCTQVTVASDPVPAAKLTSYTLPGGNLFDGTADVVFPTLAPGASPSGKWMYSNGAGYSSGRMFATEDLAVLESLKGCAGVGCSFTNADLDRKNTVGATVSTGLNNYITFYTWETSDYSWNRLTYLSELNGAAVRFEPPLNVSFAVPANTDGLNLATSKPYGFYGGASVTLTYNGFGSLWGFPYVCIDLATNLACDWMNWNSNTDMSKWVWKPAFSIPHNGTDNFVKGVRSPGVAEENFWVRPLDEEVRFVKVADTAVAADTVCTGLTLPSTSPQMPQATGFKDPTALYGTTAATVVNTAPRVIHGVVQY